MGRQVTFADSVQPTFGLPWIPVLPRERLEAMTLEELQAYKVARDTAESGAINNPVGAGWTLPIWELVMKNWSKYSIHIVLGGNQSGKTMLGSRLAVWVAGTIPEAEVYCWHITDKRSIDDQQRFVYEALPVAIKNIGTKKGIHHNLQYSQKNGFTDGICILPPHPGTQRGGSIKFFNYAQYQQNQQIIEGVKAHFCWADEVMPSALMETMKYRLMTYHGRMLLTFTVVDGWNETVQKILARTKTLQTRYCDHPRIKANLPIMQESLSVDSCAIYYAWSQDNPFTSYEEFLKLNANADKTTILARAFGIPTKSMTSVFPQFNKEVNVIKHEDLPWLKNPKYPVTFYEGKDPAGARNWFMLWIAVDSAGTWWVYREWPDDSFGEWALPGSTPEGKPGPAQKSLGYGIKDYVELVRDMEGQEQIYERFIDPRMGAAEKQSEEGATTIISDLDDAGMTVIPAPGVDIDNGLQLINNLLSWDEAKPKDSLNSPKFFISDRCQNTIYALSEYTNKGGRFEATKDPIDCLRYLAVSNPEHYDLKAADPQKPTGCY